MRRTFKLLTLLLLVSAALGCAHPLSPARQEILAALHDYMGQPYARAGDGEGGFDCSGLVQAAYRRAGVELPRSVTDQVKSCHPVPAGRLLPGDLVFFGQEPDQPTHCGIYLGEGRFAHASSSNGVTVSDLGGGYWGPRLLFGCDCLEEQ